MIHRHKTLGFTTLTRNCDIREELSKYCGYKIENRALKPLGFERLRARLAMRTMVVSVAANVFDAN